MGGCPWVPPMLLSVPGLTTALAVLCPVLTVARGVPQAVRVCKAPAAGVSRETWLLVIVVAELWLAYGFVFRVPAQIAANAPNVVLAGLIVLVVARADGTLGQSVAAVIALSAAAAAVTAASLVTNAGWVISVPAVVGSLVLFVPQLAKVLQVSDLGGVSLTTWLLALLAATSWGVYGLRIHQPPIWIPCAVTVPSSLVIVLRVLWPRPLPWH